MPVDDISDCMVLFQQGTVDSVTGDDTVLAGFVAQDPYAKIVGAAAHERAVRARDREDASRLRAVREQRARADARRRHLEADVRAVAEADRAGSGPAAGGLRAQPVSAPMTTPTPVPGPPAVPPGQLTVAPSATAVRLFLAELDRWIVALRASLDELDAGAQVAHRSRRVHVGHRPRDVAVEVDRPRVATSW